MNLKTFSLSLLCALTLTGAAQTTKIANLNGNVVYSGNSVILIENNTLAPSAENPIEKTSKFPLDIKSIMRPNNIEFYSVDNIITKHKIQAAGNVVPKALYNRPIGTYPAGLVGASVRANIGLNQKYQSYIGAAFATPWKFRNLSTNATNYKWSWGNISNYSADKDVSLKYGNNNFMIKGSFYVPVLKAYNGADSASYNLPYITWSDGNYASTLNSSASIKHIGLSDYYANVSDKNTNGTSIFLYTQGTGLPGTGNGYVWGTRRNPNDVVSGYTINSRVNLVANRYEKPMAPMVIKDITFFCYSDKTNPVPDGKKLKATLVKTDAAGKITTDTIASTEITKDDLILAAGGYLYLPFAFYNIDPETGRQKQTSIVVKDAFAIVLSGLEQDGMDFGIFSDYKNTIDNSSFFGKINEANKYFLGYYSAPATTGMNMYISINSYFDFLYPERLSTNMKAGKSGGYAVDSLGQSGCLVYSFFEDVKDSLTNEPYIWLVDSSIPSWVTVGYDKSYYDKLGGLLFVYNTQALPDSITERSANIIIKTLAAQTTIHVKQTATTSFSTNNMNNDIVVSKSTDGYKFKFFSDVKTINLFDISGQLLKTVNLNGLVEYNLPLNSLPKGLYLVQFKGSTTKSIKLIN